jgi:cell division septal protein FtsQ
MPLQKRNKIIDLKKSAARRAEAAWEAVPVPKPSQSPKLTKPQRLRARRRRMRLVMFSICLLCGAGLIGGLGLVSHAERLVIKDVRVDGAQQLSANALTAAVQSGLSDNIFKIFAKANIFLYPKKSIENALATQFPRIKDVKLSRPGLLAQAVVVTVQERQPYAKWCEGQSCYFMDSNGFIFAEADASAPTTAYLFRMGLIPKQNPIGQTFLRGRLAGIVHFLELLSAAGYKPQGIEVENEKEFAVPLTDGPTLMVPFDVEGEKILHDLQLALDADSVRGREGELQYVDLRFGNRVYYKFKGEAASE